MESLRLKEAKLSKVATTIWTPFHWPCHCNTCKLVENFQFVESLLCIFGSSQKAACSPQERTWFMVTKGLRRFPWLLDIGCYVLNIEKSNWTMTHQENCQHAMRHLQKCPAIPADAKHLSNVSWGPNACWFCWPRRCCLLCPWLCQPAPSSAQRLSVGSKEHNKLVWV